MARASPEMKPGSHMTTGPQPPKRQTSVTSKDVRTLPDGCSGSQVFAATFVSPRTANRQTGYDPAGSLAANWLAMFTAGAKEADRANTTTANATLPRNPTNQMERRPW